MPNDMPEPQFSMILYQTEDGRTRIECRFENETIWLTQALIAELFQIGVNTVNHHLKEIYDDGEIQWEATIRQYRIVRLEGSREVTRQIEHYSPKHSTCPFRSDTITRPSAVDGHAPPHRRGGQGDFPQRLVAFRPAGHQPPGRILPALALHAGQAGVAWPSPRPAASGPSGRRSACRAGSRTSARRRSPSRPSVATRSRGRPSSRGWWAVGSGSGRRRCRRCRAIRRCRRPGRAGRRS